MHQKRTLRPAGGRRGFNQKRGGGRVALDGSAQTFFVLLLFALFLSGGLYLFSVNRTAVQGYHLRGLEREIATLRDDNASLRIQEADLRSLYRIQAAQADLEMTKIETLKYLKQRDSVAIR